jgi:hypothetical protein
MNLALQEQTPSANGSIGIQRLDLEEHTTVKLGRNTPHLVGTIFCNARISDSSGVRSCKILSKDRIARKSPSRAQIAMIAHDARTAGSVFSAFKK